MKVLIVKNIAIEGPGTIEEYLREHAISYQVLNMFAPGEMPDISSFTHLVIMGGPMAVYDMGEFPFLHIEAALIRSFIKAGKAVLGICLGAQMIAYALGARVYAGETHEIGWYRVDITAEGMGDPVLSKIAVNNEAYADVFHWHSDTFDLPGDAVRIASSEVYQNQAFRYRNNVYALQFHIEVTPEMIREWFQDKGDDGVKKICEQTKHIFPEYRKRAMSFYRNFFSEQGMEKLD